MQQEKAPAGAGALLALRCRWRLGFFVFWLVVVVVVAGVTGLGFVAGLADVDAALEEGAVFDGDAGGDDVAGERAFAADVDAVGGLAVAADFAENDDLAGADVGGYLAVAADGDAVAREVDGAFDFAVDVEGLGSGDLAFDYETLADGGLFAVGDGTGSGGRCAGVKAGVAAGEVGRAGSGVAGVVPGWFGFHIEDLMFLSAVPSRGRGLSLVVAVAPMG